jgi:transcriptional/translational regulatory protein YebC/TACO1
VEELEAAQKILKAVDLFEENDDVQIVFGNFEVDDKLVDQLSAD